MFELSQIRCFVAVAEECHFRRAAARLNLSEQPLSRQIQILEQSLDVRLLDRTSRSVRLTEAGRRLLPEARRIMGMVATATETVRRVGAGERGRLRITFTAASAYSWLPKLLSEAQAAAPFFDFDLQEMVTGLQVEALLRGKADIALMRPCPGTPGLGFKRVLSEPMVAAVPATEDLAARAELRLADFAGRPVVHYASREARYFHDLVESMFAGARGRPVFVQRLSEIHSILGLVSAGVASALVPESAAKLGFESVVMRPVVFDRPYAAELVVAWRTDRETPLVRRLIDALPHDPEALS